MNDKDRELFNDIYSEAIRGRDWSIYNDETLQVLKGIHIDDNLLDEMAKDVLLEALDKWCQRNEIEKEKRNAVQEALTKMRAEMDLALKEQEMKLSAEKDEAVQKAVQEKVLELAAKGAALDVAKKPDASKPTKKKTKRGRQGSGLKGKKTKRMDEQLSEFKTWILDNHPVNESKYGCSVGERANLFWTEHKKTFNKDKKRQSENRGYACPKTLAAAYRTSVRRNRKR